MHQAVYADVVLFHIHNLASKSFVFGGRGVGGEGLVVDGLAARKEGFEESWLCGRVDDVRSSESCERPGRRFTLP